MMISESGPGELFTPRVLQNGCRKLHSTRDTTLNFEPTFG